MLHKEMMLCAPKGKAATHKITVGTATSGGVLSSTFWGFNSSGGYGSISPSSLGSKEIGGFYTSSLMGTTPITALLTKDGSKPFKNINVVRLDTGVSLDLTSSANYQVTASFFASGDVGKTISLIITTT